MDGGDYTPFYDILTGREGGYGVNGGEGTPCQGGYMVGGSYTQLTPTPYVDKLIRYTYFSFLWISILLQYLLV